MKIYTVHGSHPTIQGNPMKPHATKALADAYAAELVNLILSEYTDDDDKTPLITPDATAETWSDKCLEYRQSIADDMEVDLDELEDDDAGDVWIVVDDLVGGDDLYVERDKTITILPRVWITWDGGEKPPLPNGREVEVLLRCGVERTGIVGEDGYAKRWKHINQPDDIMGYIELIAATTFSQDDIQSIKGIKSTSLDASGIDYGGDGVFVRGKIERPRDEG